jgi:hypothetical protein
MIVAAWRMRAAARYAPAGAEQVWRRAHRLGGRIFVVFSLLPLLSALFAQSAVVTALLAAVLAPTLFATAYSWWLCSRLHGAPSQ